MFERATAANRWTGLLLAAAAVVSALPAWGQASGAAKVLTLVGQVSVMRDRSPWVLNIGDSVQPGQIVVTGADGFAVFEVADGSRFEVFPNARLIFRDNPGNWRDLLNVFVGRVKVHIQRLSGQPNYNRVRTPTAVISVRGTVFDVDVEDQDDTTVVSVEEGQVAVQHLFERPDKEKILNAGEWLRVYKNQPIAMKSVDKGSVVQNALRAAAQALYEAVYRTSRSPGPGGVGGGTGPSTGGGLPPGQSGDTDKGEPPPPPPPPPN